MTEKQKIMRAARAYKKQYCFEGKWDTFKGWVYQPSTIYAVLCELKTLRTAMLLLDKAWFE